MTLTLDHKSPKNDVIKSIREYAISFGFRIVDEDIAKPWGAYFVIDEIDIDKFFSEFFSEIKVDRKGKLTPKILLVSAFHLAGGKSVPKKALKYSDLMS